MIIRSYTEYCVPYLEKTQETLQYQTSCPVNQPDEGPSPERAPCPGRAANGHRGLKHMEAAKKALKLQNPTAGRKDQKETASDEDINWVLALEWAEGQPEASVDQVGLGPEYQQAEDDGTYMLIQIYTVPFLHNRSTLFLPVTIFTSIAWFITLWRTINFI